MFEEIGKKSFAEREHDILAFWNREQIFQKSQQPRKDKPTFTFYDGPPFATGLPHYGHLLASAIKDVVCRFMHMQGYNVPRRFGWDCHGLPIEALIEKKEGLSGSASIRAFGIAKFNEICRESVLTYTQQWRVTMNRMGRWVDMDHPYKTMDSGFMETVWWVFKQLFDQGLVYKGYKVMPFSWKLGTPLSNFEAGENYQGVDDPSLVVAFADASQENLYYLAWTTTPWTLLSNMALVVHPDMEYAELVSEGKHWILAKHRVEDVFKGKSYETIGYYTGAQLTKRRYKPLFNFFENLKENGAFQIISGDFVSLEDGTGIVHAAPAFGEDDFAVCQAQGIPLVCPINENGIFTQEVGNYSGKLWQDCGRDIIREIKNMGQLFSQATINHRYPFCYRTDTPLIYRTTENWFIAVEKIKESLLRNNKTISWVPEHIRDGRFGKWLEGAKDWAVSRNRFWGTPIPIWQAEDGDIIVVGSRKELFELSGKRVDDLHRHFIDDITITRCGKVYRRIDAVFDCWFESGSMPYAQNHYPFEGTELTEKSLPADFIGEGLDQTRGWFYTLHVLSCALFDKPAFSHVIVNGIVLAQDGNKMSKRLQNYPDPHQVLERYGADALRLYLLKSPVVRAEDLAFSEPGVDAILKQVILPWWNAFQFFTTYASLYKWSPNSAHTLDSERLSKLDHWILSRLQTLNISVKQAMHQYHLWEAIEAIVQFIEELTNWYIRRSRRRFWSEKQLDDRSAAMHTLYHVLCTLCKIAAPFAPFISETIYGHLKGSYSEKSIHLCDWPQAISSWQDPKLEEVMGAIQKFSSMGHALRKEHKFRVRQPLQKAWIVDATGKLKEALLEYSDILADELNVKEIALKSRTQDILRDSYKPNFKTLGPRSGKKMKALQVAITALETPQYQQLQLAGSFEIIVESQPFILLPEDVVVEHHVLPGQVAAHESGLAIALETHLTQELILEGMARELVNKVNTLRKEKNYEISDRIHLRLYTKDMQALAEMLHIHRSYICEETLCLQIDLDSQELHVATPCELGGHMLQINIHQVTSTKHEGKSHD